MALEEAPEITIRTKVPKLRSNAGHSAVVKHQHLVERVAALRSGHDHILDFAKLMMPHPDDPEDIAMSMYQVAQHHKVMGHALEQIERGELPRLIVTMPPRHGKTQLVSKLFNAWYLARNPYNSTAIATYNKEFAGDFGRDVRAFFQSSMFQAIFPEFELRKGSASAHRMTTKQGGTAVFVGAGTALTGRGFHLGIIDDPFKDADEADSQTIRDKRWEWFVKVFMTRQMTVGSSVIITLTRWHEDDIVGRLTDPGNSHFQEEEAKNWKIINFPFFAEENDPLKRKEGEVLWPERFTREFGEAQQRLSPRAFQALYQQRPSAQEGSYFKKGWMQFYDEAPKNEEMRIYGASDHAVATGQNNDKTCMLICGVNKNGDLYFLDCVWGRFDAQQQVDKMIDLMEKWKVVHWWAEKQHIGQALGPFLRKKKLERGVSCIVEEVYAQKDKETRARSLQGLMADMRVWWPRRGWWRLAAEEELMKFPQGTYDDLVDAASWMGMKIQQMYASRAVKVEAKLPRDSWGWWKKQLEFEKGRGSTHDVAKYQGGW